VGHGTCVVVRAPGAGTWVFDAGSRDRPELARQALLPILSSWEAGRVHIVLSHDERDHAGALAALVERYPPDRWSGALPAHLLERIAHGAERVDLATGRACVFDRGGLSFTLARGRAQDGNEGSRSLEIEAWGRSIVLCGDAEAEGLAALLDGVVVRSPCALLLLPHHGSESDLLGALLERLEPAETWVSAQALPAVAR